MPTIVDRESAYEMLQATARPRRRRSAAPAGPRAGCAACSGSGRVRPVSARPRRSRASSSRSSGPARSSRSCARPARSSAARSPGASSARRDGGGSRHGCASAGWVARVWCARLARCRSWAHRSRTRWKSCRWRTCVDAPVRSGGRIRPMSCRSGSPRWTSAGRTDPQGADGRSRDRRHRLPRRPGREGGAGYAQALSAFAQDRWGWDGARGRAHHDRARRDAGHRRGAAADHRPPVTRSWSTARSTHRSTRSSSTWTGGSSRPRSTDDYRLDLAVLEEAFAQATAGGRSAAYLLCSPHNPTGTVHTPRTS